MYKLASWDGGGALPYKSDGDARQKIRIKLLRRPIWAWLRPYLSSKGNRAKTDNQIRATVILIVPKIDGICFFFLCTTPSDTCMGPGGGGELPWTKVTGMLVVLFRGVNCRFWSHLRFSGQKANIFARGRLELSSIFNNYPAKSRGISPDT